jgi:serine/threonine-protein kinase
MAQSAHDYQPGLRVPGTVYQVVRLIGAGGMGTVYDVEDTTIGKRYVLKTLHPRLGTREDLARRMRSEARTLARLHHPNIVDVITAGVTSDSLHLPFYVMERLSGQSLRIVLDKKGRLELSHALHIGIDLLDALDHAHDKGVIHRDVKPDNIFLHRTIAGVTVTKLLDFGIMSLLDAAPNEPPGRFMGTLRYAAPEQVRGEKPSPRVDVYGAGLVIYEMLAGRGPFDDEGEPERIAAAHLQKEPPPMSRFADVPSELDQLVAVALSKSPWCRPRDAFSFATSLRNIKRVLLGGKGADSTESRTTAVGAVDATPPATLVRVQQASPDGPFVISPVGGTDPDRTTSQAPENVTPASEGPVVTSVAPATGPTSPGALASTATFTPISRPTPQDGTDVLGTTGTFAEPEPSFGPRTPPVLIPLPSLSVPSAGYLAGQRPGGSVGPQMRSFRAGARARIVGKPVTAFAIVGFVVAAASAWVVAQSARRTVAVPGAYATASTRLPAAEPFEVMRAPTIAPPAFDDIPPNRPPPALSVLAATASAPAQSPTSSPSTPASEAEKVPATAAVSSAKKEKKDPRSRTQPGRGIPVERPGPGF